MTLLPSGEPPPALHHHLLRHLKKLGVDLEAPPTPEAWGQLLAALARSYEDSDRELYLLRRSIELSSKEIGELIVRLEAERDRFAQIFRSAPVGMARVELDGTVTAANEAFGQTLGYKHEEIIGRDLLGFVEETRRPHAAQFLVEVTGGLGPTASEERLLHKGGEPVFTKLGATVVRDAGGAAQHLLLVVEDITDRTRLEIELRHSQKLESVGRLASGIAHEINTPIQFVGSNIMFLDNAFGDLLRLCATYRAMCDKAAAAPLGPEDLAALREAEDVADLDYVRANVSRSIASTQDGIARVAKIVQSMKTFAHPDRGERANADLNAALLSTLTVASNELKYVARVETELCELPLVPCYLSDLNQVFLNLLINAAHAIADVVRGSEQKGVIRVKTSRDGEHVVVSISDTGTGIPEAIRLQVFEPFFTTKEVGRGTGQGLALARSVVVEKHGGTLTFETAVGKGTTFHIRLPLPPEERGSSAAAS